MSLLSWIYNTDSATGKSGTELDNELAALNAQRLASGYYNADQYAQATANLEKSHVDVNAELSGAFKEGWQEGQENIKGAVGGGINGLVKSIAGILPWQVWLIGGALAVFYFWPVIGPGLGIRLKLK